MEWILYYGIELDLVIWNGIRFCILEWNGMNIVFCNGLNLLYTYSPKGAYR